MESSQQILKNVKGSIKRLGDQDLKNLINVIRMELTSRNSIRSRHTGATSSYGGTISASGSLINQVRKKQNR